MRRWITTVLLALLVATQVPDAIFKGLELASKRECVAARQEWQWFFARLSQADGKWRWRSRREQFHERCEWLEPIAPPG